MFWRKRSVLAPPNVGLDWIALEAWRTWEAPSNHVAGEASYVPALAKLVGPACSSGYCVFTPVRLVRERHNKYDPNAFRAEVRGQLIGYLRKELAVQLAAPLDSAGCAAFEVCGVVRGGSTRAKHLGVHVWLGRRVTPGPAITVVHDTWQVAWPPTGREVSAFL